MCVRVCGLPATQVPDVGTGAGAIISSVVRTKDHDVIVGCLLDCLSVCLSIHSVTKLVYLDPLSF